MFNYKYSPRESDPAWFGFFKVECEGCSGFPSYVKVGCKCFCVSSKLHCLVKHTLQTHIALVMLIACSYSVQRRQVRNRVFYSVCIYSLGGHLQKQYYLHNFIDIPKADKTALFWGIGIDEMDKSLLKTIAYLVSHVFDLYGLEVIDNYCNH